jgi:hypothetical protein
MISIPYRFEFSEDWPICDYLARANNFHKAKSIQSANPLHSSVKKTGSQRPIERLNNKNTWKSVKSMSEK